MERLLQRPVSCLGDGNVHMLGPDLVGMDQWMRYSFQGDGQDQLSAFLTLSYRGHPAIMAMPKNAQSDRPGDVDNQTWNEKLRLVEVMATPLIISSNQDAFFLPCSLSWRHWQGSLSVNKVGLCKSNPVSMVVPFSSEQQSTLQPTMA
jgi:hypothetical protein